MIKNNHHNKPVIIFIKLRVNATLALLLPDSALPSINFDRAIHENTVDAIEHGIKKMPPQNAKKILQIKLQTEQHN